MKKILILAANPRGDLNLNREIRVLKEVIRRSRNQQTFEIEVEVAVSPEDLHELLLVYEPQIVHFCGHGTGRQGLMFHGELGQEPLVDAATLSSLFGLFAEKVECVLLNACYSEEQASAIVQHINYVIGVNQAIHDDAAIAFSTGFYRALGYGRSIEQAYQFGCNAIQLASASRSKSHLNETENETEADRKLELANPQIAAIPEHLKPILRKKSNLPPLEEPTATEENNRLLEQALEKENAIKQYREQGRQFLTDRWQQARKFLAEQRFTNLEDQPLQQLRKTLNLPGIGPQASLAEPQPQLEKKQASHLGRYPVPARDVPDPVSEAKLQIALNGVLSSWQKVTSSLPEDPDQNRVELFRQYKFNTFLDAVAFISKTAPGCETAMHHPRWENLWRTVNIYLTTWDIGHQISDRDILLAEYFDQAFAALPQSDSSRIYPNPPAYVPDPINQEKLQIALNGALSSWQKVTSPLPEDPDQNRVELFRQYNFKTFLDAVAFMNKVAPSCELRMHHPRWENLWRTVSIYLTTWDIGHQISDRDILLAKYFDQAFVEFSKGQKDKIPG